ncbi:GTP-binding protein Obg [Nanoarchaeota archaeon]
MKKFINISVIYRVMDWDLLKKRLDDDDWDEEEEDWDEEDMDFEEEEDWGEEW